MILSTEDSSPRFADIDLWPTHEAVAAMLEAQLAAAAAVQSQVAGLAAAAEDAAARLNQTTGRLVYVGAGTSGRLAVQDGAELRPTYNWPKDRVVFLLAGGTEALLSSIEGAEDDTAAAESATSDLSLTANDVVIGVSASGRTAYTVAAVKAAAASGAMTVGISSNAGSPLLLSVAHPIVLDTGGEVVAGSTRMKAGTAQKIALNLFSTAVMLRLGGIYKGRMVTMRVSNRKLHSRAVAMIRELAGVDETVAEEAIAHADGELKVAILIASGATLDEARTLLQSARGDLRSALSCLKSASPHRDS